MKREELLGLIVRLSAETEGDPIELRKRLEEELFLIARRKRFKARLNQAHTDMRPLNNDPRESQ